MRGYELNLNILTKYEIYIHTFRTAKRTFLNIMLTARWEKSMWPYFFTPFIYPCGRQYWFKTVLYARVWEYQVPKYCQLLKFSLPMARSSFSFCRLHLKYRSPISLFEGPTHLQLTGYCLTNKGVAIFYTKNYSINFPTNLSI